MKNVVSKNGVWKTAPLNDTPSGGPLVVNVTPSDNAMVLDKTWQEIYDADAVSIVFDNAGENERTFFFCSSVFERAPIGGDDTQYVVKVNDLVDSQIIDFIASSESGYPSYKE